VETIKFCDFEVLKKQKTALKVLKIELEYSIKKMLGKLLGKNKTEQFGNAYTVLTETSTQNLQIF
jgi:hypothetical protein